LSKVLRIVDVVRGAERRSSVGTDKVAVEAPLEVALEGHAFAVIMRTPGADADLVAGFLFTEGVIRSADDVRRIESGESANHINVRLSRARAEVLPELLGGRREVAMNSSCGVCGRRSLESLNLPASPFAVTWTVSPAIVSALPGALREAQPTFDETGGLHAAALIGLDARLILAAEDVGRHNAVDKLIGRMLMDRRLPLEAHLLFVSGRSSFEIVQKALAGGIRLIAAVSAPSSLAIDLADRGGITLLGFVRERRFNAYTHPRRVEGLG
jgi:FdhD protein